MKVMASSDQQGKAGRRSWIIAAGVAIVVLIGGAGSYQLRSSADQSGGAAPQTRITLDPKLFDGPARQAYEVADRDPALLAQLHCYCGCDVELHHRNLLDCYRTDHGAHCPTCTGEAIDAQNLADEGMPVDQIRRVLRDRYGHED